MRIVVDFDLCEANGMCEAVAPDVFEIDEDDNLHIIAEPTPELRDSIEQAVQSCPKAALSLED
ncbi:ferredoxin [Saccharopolyspora rhizosphaerae]|uniref:Ferredoxin n=1 Tax=Saccharopolyspora rhizosphaerae TaxID=2492662 RepID=A0A426JWP3_9PSEU|nr:ferredoxin [Saccharopolyspora rhizosphaerae]RRO17523.1 ferredoxin [Saccharopolyspora rhizosphaerae]